MSQNIIVKIGEQRFCAYCGKPIKPNEHNQYRCDCPDAKLAIKLIDEAMNLEFEASKKRNLIPKPRFGSKTVCAPIDYNTLEEDNPDPCF